MAGYLMLTHRRSPTVIPEALSPAQMEIALSELGMLDSVNAYLTTASAREKIIWRRTTAFERSNSTLISAGAALGLTDAQIDGLFAYGASVNV